MDSYGRPVWSRDGDGFLSYTEYDPFTGAVVKAISDVNTTQTGDFSGLPSGWGTPAGGGLHLSSNWEVDALGRVVKETDPASKVSYTVYNDAAHEVRLYQGWNSSTNTATLPTQVYREDRAWGYTEVLTMSATPSVVGGRPTGQEAIGTVWTLARSSSNSAGQLTHSDAYFDLSGLSYSTSTTLGAEGTNYYRTRYDYINPRGWLSRVESPTGTIQRTVDDSLGRVVSTWVGTDDTPTTGFWSPTNL